MEQAKQKRIKRVFSSSTQVLHLWANQSQDSARCRNVFFKGPSCYSYGYHYELGRLVQYRGQTVAMINTEGYSVTTRRHIYEAFSATSHLIALGTAGDLMDVRGALIEKQATIIDALFNHFRSRIFSKDFCWNSGRNYGDQNSVKEFNLYCDKLGHPELKLEVTKDFVQLYDEHVRACIQRQEELNSPEAIAKREADRVKRAEKAKLKLAKDIEAWKSGGVLKPALRDLEPQLLRVVGDEVQTTKGASVPLSHARRLLGMVLRGTAKAGEPVGSFRLSRVNGETVQIGCHTIALDEAKSILTPHPTVVGGAE